MPIDFITRYSPNGSYVVARIESSRGGVYTVNPLCHPALECSVSHQAKGGKHGFGIKLVSGDSCVVLPIGALGDAEKFLKEIKQSLNNNAFWNQN